MNGFVLFTYTASIAVACMSLALAIAAMKLHREPWTGKFIVLQSALIGVMVFCTMERLSITFMGGIVFQVFNLMFNVLSIACMAFVIVFIPYILSWVIARPWRFLQRVVFYPAAMAYFGVGLASQIIKNETFSFWSGVGQTIAILAVFIYCIVILWTNLKVIDDGRIREVCRTINIVSLAMIPISGFSLFYYFIRDFSYPLYVLAFSIVVMVYMFGKFRTIAEAQQKQPTLTLESLAQYKITDREFSVIKLICDGLTNKEIADQLCISVNTVNNHVANIFGKMEVRSRIDLLKLLKEGPWA